MRTKEQAQRWNQAIAEGRVVRVPQDGGQSYFRECLSAEDAAAFVAKSRASCWDVERYGATIVSPELAQVST